jgi:hypothetical protein
LRTNFLSRCYETARRIAARVALFTIDGPTAAIRPDGRPLSRTAGDGVMPRFWLVDRTAEKYGIPAARTAHQRASRSHPAILFLRRSTPRHAAGGVEATRAHTAPC